MRRYSASPARSVQTSAGGQGHAIWLNRVVVPLSDEELLILRLTAMRYKMDGHSILRMSAALFMIVAELSWQTGQTSC